eukprot:9503817-Pyramimonas_sp.AAC.5
MRVKGARATPAFRGSLGPNASGGASPSALRTIHPPPRILAKALGADDSLCSKQNKQRRTSDSKDSPSTGQGVC